MQGATQLAHQALGVGLGAVQVVEPPHERLNLARPLPKHMHLHTPAPRKASAAA